jgi:hypothetical protein
MARLAESQALKSNMLGDPPVRVVAALAADPPKGQAGLTFLELLPDALHRLKEDFEADRQEMRAAWRARRHYA